MKQIQNVFFIIVLGLLQLLSGSNNDEFLYPVASVIHESIEKICVLHQKNNHLELWLWNPVTGIAIRGLLSSFIPSGLDSLPSKYAFSFIDNDRIRVKHLDKRSPRTIDFYGPYDITALTWIDNKNFYFFAQENICSSIFHGTIEGELYKIVSARCDEGVSVSYPSKINDLLFYIHHDASYKYSIMKTIYPTYVMNSKKTYISNIINSIKFIEHSSIIDDEENIITVDTYKTEVIFNHNKPMTFLTMHSETEGYFIDYDININILDTVIKFGYNELFFDAQNNIWHSRLLFNFTIPSHLIISMQFSNQVRLYESILRLLPKEYYNKIYFLNYNEQTFNLEFYSFDKNTNNIECYNHENIQNNIYMFSPFQYHTTIYYGGTLLNICNYEDDTMQYLINQFKNTRPLLWIEKNDEIHISLPNLTINS